MASSQLFFVEGVLPAKKPSLLEKKKITELRSRGFGGYTGEYKTKLKTLFQLVKGVVITDTDVDDFAMRCKHGEVGLVAFPHPYFWRRLGFTCEDPEFDFKAYVEPQVGVTPFDAMTPSNARWCGGILTLDCLLYFLQHPNPRIAERGMWIVSHRLRMNELSPNYRIIVVCMDLVRSLGLTLYILSSKMAPASTKPIQPNCRPFPPYEIDYVAKERVKSPESYYPMRSFWGYLKECAAFERLFCSVMQLFDFHFSMNPEHPDQVMRKTGEFFEELLVTTTSLTDLETKVENYTSIST